MSNGEIWLRSFLRGVNQPGEFRISVGKTGGRSPLEADQYFSTSPNIYLPNPSCPAVSIGSSFRILRAAGDFALTVSADSGSCARLLAGAATIATYVKCYRGKWTANLKVFEELIASRHFPA